MKVAQPAPKSLMELKVFVICYRRRFLRGCPERLSSGRTALQATNRQSMHGKTDGNRPQNVAPTSLLAVCRHTGKAFLQMKAALPAPGVAKAVLHAGGPRGLRARNHRPLLSAGPAGFSDSWRRTYHLRIRLVLCRGQVGAAVGALALIQT